MIDGVTNIGRGPREDLPHPRHVNWSSKNRWLVRHDTILLAMACATPFVALFSPYAVLGVYLLITLFGLTQVRHIPVLLAVQAFGTALLMLAHSSGVAEVLNLGSLMLSSFYGLVIASVFARKGLETGYRLLVVMTLWSMGLAALFSTLMAGPLGLSSPFSAITTGDRLLLLGAPGNGHSILNEWATIVLIGTLSGIIRSRWRHVLAGLMSVLLILAGSSTAFLVLVLVWLIRFSEGRRQPAHVVGDLLRSCLYIGALIGATVIVLQPQLTNDIMKSVRQMAGQGEGHYNNDYTAGRALLNVLLIDAANQNPLTGGGRDLPIIQYGTQSVTGKKGAVSESPLRLAAQYGWPYFALNALVWMTPLVLALLSTGIYRRIFLMAGASLIMFSLTNGALAVAYSPTSLAFGPVLWFALITRRSELVRFLPRSIKSESL